MGVVAVVGLTYIDQLSLAWYQWGLVLLLPWLPDSWQAAGQAVTLVAFWNQPIGTDSRLLWQAVAQLQGLSWQQIKSEVIHKNYVSLQNPWVTFALSRLPVFPFWQVGLGACCLLSGMASTPLSLIMMTQPGHDVISFLLARLAYSCRSTILTASLLYGVACIAKPSALVLLPVMLVRLRWGLLGSLFLCFGAWLCLSPLPVGRRQTAFITTTGLLTPRNRPIVGRVKAIRRRWKRFYGWTVLGSLAFYLGPFWLSYTWEHVLVSALLLLLAPNPKYFLLVIVCS